MNVYKTCILPNALGVVVTNVCHWDAVLSLKMNQSVIGRNCCTTRLLQLNSYATYVNNLKKPMCSTLIGLLHCVFNYDIFLKNFFYKKFTLSCVVG